MKKLHSKVLMALLSTLSFSQAIHTADDLIMRNVQDSRLKSSITYFIDAIILKQQSNSPVDEYYTTIRIHYNQLSDNGKKTLGQELDNKQRTILSKALAA